MGASGGHLPANGVGETARGADGKMLSRSAQSMSEGMPDFGTSTLDYGDGLTDDILHRLREWQRTQLYRRDRRSWQNANTSVRLSKEARKEHEDSLAEMLGKEPSTYHPPASIANDKEILTNWVARRAFEQGKSVRQARRQMIWELERKYAKPSQLAELAEFLSYLLCFRVGLPLFPSHNMPQQVLVPEEHFPAESTPNFVDRGGAAAHRSYLSQVIPIRHELEYPDPLYSEGIDLVWNSWSIDPHHNFSVYTRRFDAFALVQAWRADEDRPAMSVAQAHLAIYKQHPICLFVDRFFPNSGGILDLIAIIQSDPGTRNQALQDLFVGKVAAALREGLAKLMPFVDENESRDLLTATDVQRAHVAARKNAADSSSPLDQLTGSVTGIYAQLSSAVAQPIGFDNPLEPARNVDWGPFAPLLCAACTGLLSAEYAVSSHISRKVQDPLLTLLQAEIFPGLDRWSISDGLSYALMAFGIMLGIAAIIASGGFAAPWLAGLALAFDGLGIALSADQLRTAIGDTQQMEFEGMFTALRPSLAAYQADSSVGWAVAMLIFDFAMLRLPSVAGKLLSPPTAQPAMDAPGSAARQGKHGAAGPAPAAPVGIPPANRGSYDQADVARRQIARAPDAAEAITPREKLVGDPPNPAARENAATDPVAQGTDAEVDGVRGNTADALDGRSIEVRQAIDELEEIESVEDQLYNRAHSILYGANDHSESLERALRLSRDWADRLVRLSRTELDTVADQVRNGSSAWRDIPPEIRAILTDPDNKVSSFWRHPKSGNLLYSKRGGGGGGLVFPDARVSRSLRAGAGFRQPSLGSAADHWLREIWDAGGYSHVMDIGGQRHNFFFDRRARVWFHERQLDRGHIQSAVSKGIELHTRVIESLRRGDPEGLIREQIATYVANFNSRSNNLLPEARSTNRYFGGAETRRYGDLLQVSERSFSSRLAAGPEELTSGLSSQQRIGYQDIYDETWFMAPALEDQRFTQVFELSNAGGFSYRGLDDQQRLRDLFAADLNRLRQELAEQNFPQSTIDRIISLCGPPKASVSE